MNPSNLNLRLAVVAIVTLISLWLSVPTFRYFSVVMSGEPLVGESIDNMRRASVPLGLDLQGGVDVLLSVDREKTESIKLEAVAEDLRRRFQREAPVIDATVDVTSGSRSLAVTVNRADQIRSVDNILTRFQNDGIFQGYVAGSIQPNQRLQVEVVSSVLAEDFNKAIQSSLKVLRERVDKLGVTQPIVVQQGADRIRVQIPGEKNPDEVVRNVIRPAQLEFRGVYSSQIPVVENNEERFPDASSEIIDITTGRVLPGKSIPPGFEVKTYRHTTRGADGRAMDVDRYILVRRRVEMTGATIKDARVMMSEVTLGSGGISVIIEFSAEGARQFAEVSEKFVRRQLAIILDGVVYSAPNVRGVIAGGVCTIEGSFSLEEARNLALVLKAGALPAEMKILDQRTVEATLGADSIKASVNALVLGAVVVAIAMSVYYGIAGVIAVVAVLINVLLVFAFMKLSAATLTLSGIGGILLTVGMAVDANILIYERIREELRDGKTIKQAVSLGFEKAFSTIFDANLTTLISGLVLLQFGEGSVKGFALALNVGILATLFTGLFVTKALVEFWLVNRQSISVGTMQIFNPTKVIDFVQMKKTTYGISLVVFAASVVWVLPFGPFPGSNWGVDFEGGVVTELKTRDAVNTQRLQSANSSWRVQKVAGENQFIVRAKMSEGQTIQQIRSQVEADLNRALGEGKYTILGSESVSNQVGQEFTRRALIAAVLASLGILMYIAFRFQAIFGFAAVVALIHDVVISYGIFNMMGSVGLAGEVTLDVVAAMLVIIGYSVNDTIVTFDRIRENMALHPGMAFREIVNRSIQETLNRTITTAGTVVFVLLAMILLGGSGLFDFALVLLLGMIAGTYSSIFVAAPVLEQLYERRKKKMVALQNLKKARS
jgi:SecD/SecF fusion protein